MKKIFFLLAFSLFGLSAVNAQCSLNLSITPNEVCAGQPVTLVVTNNLGIPLQEGTGYYFHWSDGVTTPSRVEFPSTNTTYSVTVTYAQTGCSTSMQRTAVVTPHSFLNLTAEPSSFCAGGASVLTMRDNMYNPLPNGYGWSYLWSTGATTAQIVVSPNVTTTYTVTVTEPGGCTQVMPPQTVTVLPKPNVTIEQSQGVGQTTLLAYGSGDFTWGNGSKNQFLKVDQTGWYMVTITDQNGCTNSASVDVTGFLSCPPSDTVLVEVPVYVPYPVHDTIWLPVDTVLVVETITVEVPVYVPYPVYVHDTTYIVHCPDGITASYNNGVVCTGDYLFLSAPFADSYEWGEEVVDKNYIIDTDNPGITTYTCTTTTNGIHTTYYFTVYVYAPMPKPVIATVGGETVFCDSTYLSSDQVAPHFQYQWYRNGVSLFGETGPVVKIGVSGDYSVKVTTPCGTQTSNITWITIANCGTTGGVDGDEEDDFNVYPNPSNGVFYVDMPNDTGLQYILYDINGKVVLQEIAENDFEVEALHLPTGTYVLQVITDSDELYTKKIEIQ